MNKPEQMGSRITLANVAHMAGVSVSTASLALRGSPQLARQTRRKVWAASRKVGYSANIRPTKRLRIDVFEPKPQIRNLGFILVDDDTTSPACVGTFHGAALEATRHGQHLFCYPAVARDADFNLDLLQSADCDGFLMMGWIEERHYNLLNKIGKPIVILGDHHIPQPVNEVSFRYRDAGRTAVRYLASLGHCRIALSCDDLRFLHRQEFWRGYLEGMEAAGLPVGAGWVQTAPRLVPHLDVVKPLFELAEPPTAVIATSHGEAQDLIGYVRSLGLRVPQDVSVLFFGLTRADHRPISITFLEMSGGDLGRIGVRRLQELIADPQEIPLTTRLHLTLRDHGTCGPATARRGKLHRKG